MASVTVTANAAETITLSGTVVAATGAAGSTITATGTHVADGSIVNFGTLTAVPDGTWSFPPISVPTGVEEITISATSTVTVTGTLSVS